MQRLSLPRHLPPAARHFTTTSSRSLPRTASQSRTDMNIESTEYSRSSTDDEAARRSDAAFDPKVTDPEAERKLASKGSDDKETSNPLDVSPANPEVSKGRGWQEGGPENSGGDVAGKRTGGAGSPRKGKDIGGSR